MHGPSVVFNNLFVNKLLKRRLRRMVGGELHDVAEGWTHYPLDGSPPGRRYSGCEPGFDTAVVARAGDFVALLCGTGTQGLLFDSGGDLVREVNHRYYHADAYRYPLR